MRRAEPSDLRSLVDLVHSAMPHPWSQDQIGDALVGALSRVWLIFAAREVAPDSAPVGFVVARRIADGVEIDLVGTAPEHRRRGLGRELVTQLIAAEEAEGAGEARLELAESNAVARALYEGLGFVVVGRRSRYYPDGEDALLLTRPLG